MTTTKREIYFCILGLMRGQGIHLEKTAKHSETARQTEVDTLEVEKAFFNLAAVNALSKSPLRYPSV